MPVSRSRNLFMFALIAMLALMACQNPQPAAPATQTAAQEPPNRGRGGLGGDDDAPIIIASGSMYLATDPQHLLTSNKADKVEWTDNGGKAVMGYKVSSIDVVRYNADDVEMSDTYTVTGDTEVEIDYCKNNCNGNGNHHTVRLSYLSSKNSPTITLTDRIGNGGIIDIKQIGKSHLWSHPKTRFRIEKVHVGGATYAFTDGKGHIVVHVCETGNCK